MERGMMVLAFQLDEHSIVAVFEGPGSRPFSDEYQPVLPHEAVALSVQVIRERLGDIE